MTVSVQPHGGNTTTPSTATKATITTNAATAIASTTSSSISTPKRQLDGSTTTLPLPSTASGSALKWRLRRRRRVLFLTALLLLFTTLLLPLMALHRYRPIYVWRRALHWYLRMLHVRPLLARALSAALIFLVADLTAQKCTSHPLCLHRLLRYSSYGGLIVGPFLYGWYSAMNAYAPRDDAPAALAKCLFEQITLEPFCIVLYIVYDGLLCRRGWRGIVRRTRIAFFPLWFKNAVFWMPANFFNYYIATPDLRVIFSNLCSLFWNAYFSSKINQASTTTKKVSTNPSANGIGDTTPSKNLQSAVGGAVERRGTPAKYSVVSNVEV